MDNYSMAASDALTAEDMAIVGGVLGIYGAILMFILSVFLFIFIFYAALFIASRIPYYKMAKRAGLDNPWLIWIPIAEMYVMLKLPRREFNIFNWIRTYDRTKVFWYWLGISLSLPVIYGILYVFMIIPIINFIALMLFYVVMLVYMVVIYIFSWRVSYDILMTYGMREHAMWAAIANCFCPIIMIVFSYMIMNKEPDYSV